MESRHNIALCSAEIENFDIEKRVASIFQFKSQFVLPRFSWNVLYTRKKRNVRVSNCNLSFGLFFREVMAIIAMIESTLETAYGRITRRSNRAKLLLHHSDPIQIDLTVLAYLVRCVHFCAYAPLVAPSSSTFPSIVCCFMPFASCPHNDSCPMPVSSLVQCVRTTDGRKDWENREQR